MYPLNRLIPRNSTKALPHNTPTLLNESFMRDDVPRIGHYSVYQPPCFVWTTVRFNIMNLKDNMKYDLLSNCITHA